MFRIFPVFFRVAPKIYSPFILSPSLLKNFHNPKLFQQSLSYVRKIDLPLELRVNCAHQILKKGLIECKIEFPKGFVESLRSVRKINWASYNVSGLSFNVGQDAKKILQELIEFECKLPDELKWKGAFDHLRQAKDCIEDRVNTPAIFKV